MGFLQTGRSRWLKSNKQADLTGRTGQKVEQILLEAIKGNPVLNAAAIPAGYSNLLISKTEAGGGYGLHIDNPFMRLGKRPLRTDLSFTLFLSEPMDYSGGELVIEQAGQTHEVKPGAGDLVLYPSTSLHKVAPIISGQRLACVGWVESWIKSPEDRETLFDLTNLQAQLQTSLDAQSAELLMLSKVIANLKRRFS